MMVQRFTCHCVFYSNVEGVLQSDDYMKKKQKTQVIFLGKVTFIHKEVTE